MERIVIDGLKRLDGEVGVQGAKNSALPILAATVITGQTSVIHNCPELTDIDATLDILKYIGCRVKRDNGTLVVDSGSVNGYDIPERLMNEMRSSIVFLGPMLARFGKAVVSHPGGCDIGLRPINLHISALEQLGVSVEENNGRIFCSCDKGLRGAKIVLSFPSVGATENIMLAAVSAIGTTTIINAAREPEIVDLADFLTKCGAKIFGAGAGIIVIEGVKGFTDCEHSVIPDRIIASTLMSAVAVTKGHALIKNVISDHLAPVISLFEKSGCTVTVSDDSLELKAPKKLNSFGTIRTMPYPGFPTDAQSAAVVMAAVAGGTSVVVENIFENRYRLVNELVRMGAHITVENTVAVIEGVPYLHGTHVNSGDLRGGAALVIAGLASVGETTVFGVHHIDRGCERLEEKLALLGADIKRKRD